MSFDDVENDLDRGDLDDEDRDNFYDENDEDTDGDDDSPLGKMNALFEKNEDERGKFERIANQLSARKDVHAFMLMDKIMPHKKGWNMMIGSSSHDIFHLSIDCNELAEIITEDQVIELMRCGVMFSLDDESLSMFS